MSSPGAPVVCFSYLAAASLWRVTQFPGPSYGAEVHAIEESIAADGATAAAVLAGLGLPSLLLANVAVNRRPGDDVSIILDYRTDPSDPRVVGSDPWSGQRWACSPTDGDADCGRPGQRALPARNGPT